MMFNIGFETEFVSPAGLHITRNQLRLDGIEAELRDSWTPGNYRVWGLTTDGSITDRNGRTAGGNNGMYGLELISPIMPIKQGLREMRKVFRYLEENNCYTNESTGFHMGFSFQHRMLNEVINKNILVFHSQEVDLLNLWKRRHHQYCESHAFKMISYLRNWDRIHNIERLQDKLVNDPPALDDEKYRTFNFRKLRGDNPYIECRIMGGKDYHKRYTDVLKTVKTICRALLESVELDAKVDPWFVEHTIDQYMNNR